MTDLMILPFFTVTSHVLTPAKRPFEFALQSRVVALGMEINQNNQQHKFRCLRPMKGGGRGAVENNNLSNHAAQQNCCCYQVG